MIWAGAWASAWQSVWSAMSGGTPATVARPEPGVLTVTGFAPAVVAGVTTVESVPRFVTIPTMPRVVHPTPGRAYAIGHAPTVDAAVRVVVIAPTIVAPAPLERATIDAMSGLCIVRSFAPTVVARAAPRIRPIPPTLRVRRYAPTIAGPDEVRSARGTMTWTGYAPLVLVPSIVTPGAAAPQWTGHAPTIDARDLPFTVTRWTPDDDESDVAELLMLVALL